MFLFCCLNPFILFLIPIPLFAVHPGPTDFYEEEGGGLKQLKAFEAVGWYPVVSEAKLDETMTRRCCICPAHLTVGCGMVSCHQRSETGRDDDS